MHTVYEIVILPIMRESRREAPYGLQCTQVHEPMSRHHERHLQHQGIVGSNVLNHLEALAAFALEARVQLSVRGFLHRAQHCKLLTRRSQQP